MVPLVRNLILMHDSSPLQAISRSPLTSRTRASFGTVRGAAKEMCSPRLRGTRRYARDLVVVVVRAHRGPRQVKIWSPRAGSDHWPALATLKFAEAATAVAFCSLDATR